jgi:ribosome biogenesis GTPase
MKIDDTIRSTNPIAVGDIVHLEEETQGEGTNAMITEVEPRRNYIIRVSPHNKNQKHIVAANLDLALLIATVNSPRTSSGFVDRFLLTAEAYHIPAIVVVNKIDLLKEKHQDIYEEWESMWEPAGYELYPVQATKPETVERLRAKLEGKTTLLTGHSGVGKSTLINLFIPGANLRTTEVSDWSGKGQHTTTFAEMHDMPEGKGRIVDTPGVKEFGLIDMEKGELGQYFPEIRRLMSHCRFNNCTHVAEPDCAVKTAVEEGRLSAARYYSYLGILDSIDVIW